MLPSSRLSAKTLRAWCRAARHGLSAGLSPVAVFRQQARSGPAAARPLAAALADRMAAGESLADAVARDRRRFPALVVELLAVGEQAGRLEDTFRALEDHFQAVVEARRTLSRALVFPGLMFAAAVLTVTVLIFVMGLLPGGFDPIGLGVGPAGAGRFLFGVGSAVAAAAFLGYGLAGDERARGRLEGLALPLPWLGGAVRAFALQRFSMAFHMTAEAGLRADRALKLSLRATANTAYVSQADRAAAAARGGQEVADILAGCGPHLFPRDYVDVAEVGEQSGQLAEVMAKLADQYREEAARQLKTLAQVAGGLVYAAVAGLVIVVIFRIAMSIAGVYQSFGA